MKKEVEILKLDHGGRGIAYIDSVITFVHGALPGEIVLVEIISPGPKYNIAKAVDIKKNSPKRVSPKCPYAASCGGCALMSLSYKDTLEYKKNKVSEILTKYAKLNPEIEMIKSPDIYNYRNKIRFQLVAGKINYFEYDSNNLTNINKCLIAKRAINDFLDDISYLNIKDAEVSIRCNYNDELLIIIESKEKNNIEIQHLKDRHKIVGVIFNKKTVYGEPYFMEMINGKLFRVSYDAFFQINNFINKEIFRLLNHHILENARVLDLYCGVGTLGISIACKVSSVSGIEIIPNATRDALINSKMNKIKNINFFLGSVSEVIKKTPTDFDALIIDPPRSGLMKRDLEIIMNMKPKQIIYISCDAMTLARDLNIIKKDYEIDKFYLLDMFPYTYHVENMCTLSLK